MAQEGSNVDPILIMEHVDGGNLEDLMANSILPLHNCIAVWRQLLSALKYIHDQNILHRDVKPSNILVASNPDDFSVKLCDFGLSTQEQRARTFGGAQRYLAPEALLGKDRYDGKVDVWSTAVVVLEALNGLPPHTESRDWTTEIISINASLLGIGFRSRILQRMLQLRPADRLSANEALRELVGFDQVYEQASWSSFDGAGRHEVGRKDSIREVCCCPRLICTCDSKFLTCIYSLTCAERDIDSSPSTTKLSSCVWSIERWISLIWLWGLGKARAGLPRSWPRSIQYRKRDGTLELAAVA